MGDRVVAFKIQFCVKCGFYPGGTLGAITVPGTL